MIPRTLVPKGARPPQGEIVSTRRRPSALDERTLVPSTLPIVPLDGRSTIPSNLPLESIATRVVVPRDIDVEAVKRPDESNLPPQPTDMDERITIPFGVVPPLEVPELPPISEDLVEPDIIQTGEVMFLPPARAQKKATVGEMIVLSASLTLNLLFILAIYEVLTYRPHGREVEEIGRKQMEVLLPPGALAALKPSPPPEPRPTVRVDPREIRKIAPPIEAPPPPEPKPEPKKELPSAPTPKPNVMPPTPQPAQGDRGDLPKPQLKLDTPNMPVPQRGLVLPKQNSPGDEIRDAARAVRPNSPVPIGRNGPIGSGGGGRGRPGAHGTAGSAIEMLTPDQGVDFHDYMRRVYIIVYNNWISVMPASVELGDAGELSLTFKIYQNGSVEASDPRLVYSSGKEPLDRAAVSSIRASNPFPPLPGEFKGPYIELRYTYCYNEQSCPNR